MIADEGRCKKMREGRLERESRACLVQTKSRAVIGWTSAGCLFQGRRKLDPGVINIDQTAAGAIAAFGLDETFDAVMESHSTAFLDCLVVTESFF